MKGLETKLKYYDERTKDVVNGHKMEAVFKRSKGESVFGVKGSRIFELEIKKDGQIVGSYDKGWTIRVNPEDEETKLFLTHILATFGKEKEKKRKE